MQSIEMCYRNLGNAIILQAVDDYRNALRGKSYHKCLTPESIVKETENFFRSSYFGMLTKVKGEYLIHKLKEEYYEEIEECESN